MGLRVRTETIGFVQAKDLEAFVAEVYPFVKRYSFAAVQECGNDSDHTFRADGSYTWGEADWQEVVDEGFVTSNYLLMDRLVMDGHITPGTYVVRVSW